MTVISLWPFQQNSAQKRFEKLIQPHLKQLYRLAWRFTGNKDDAEDLVQDLLLKLYPRLDELEKLDKPAPWLAKVLYRQYVDSYRSRQRSPLEFTENEAELYATHEDPSPSPAQAVQAGQMVSHLQQALDRLNEEQRMVVLLHDVEGYTLQEIGDIQGVTTGTIKSRLHRARNKLQELLTDTEPSPGDSRVKEVTG